MADKLASIPTFKQPSRLPDQVAEFLAAEIKKGTFPTGNKLPSESTLAKQFGVSRTVIREALAKLKYDGLLESRQGSGAIVMGDTPPRAFRLNKVEEGNLIDLGHLYELRAILEGNAAFLAAERRTRDDLKNLSKCIKDMAEAVRQGADGTDADTRFHQFIATAAQNRYLQDLMLFLTGRLRHLIKQARTHSSREPELPGLVQKEHEAIFRAIDLRDPEKARAAVLDHLANAARRLGLSNVHPLMQSREPNGDKRSTSG